MGKTTRRNFIKNAGLGVAGVSLSSFMTASTKYPKKSNRATLKFKEKLSRLNLGMASYTFREFPLEDTLRMTKRLGLERIAFKDFHLSLESTVEEIKTVSKKTKEAGLDLYGCGVVYMKNEQEVERAFNYAKTAGMKVIIGVPNHELLNVVNKMVDKHNIKVAIHNHGPGDKLYPTPESAYARIKNLDPRIGLCIDIGHTKRAGVDPSESAIKFADRLHDVHIKDVTSATKEGGTIEIGHGVIDIPKFLKTLLKLNYKGSVSFEFEKDGKDPLPGVAESVGYVRGVLATI
ncbi:MAG: sugar phosphate isomerase/epimerase [Candidatus Aminicenantes bacterium]|nr:MAG: sugar phosphate isomerase/epimerase [Candidatus Aminicenantes bacterium]